MLYKKLFRLQLIFSFGQGSDKPLTAAVIKFGGALATALIVGVLLGSSLWKADLPKDLPAQFIFALMVSASFVISSLAVLTVSSFNHSRSTSANLASQMQVLPLNRFSRWIINCLPIFYVTLIVLFFGIPAILGLSHAFGLPQLICQLMLFLGALSGAGFNLLPWKHVFVKLSAFIAISVGLFWLIEKMLSVFDQKQNMIFNGILMILIVLCSGVILSYFYQTKLNKNSLPQPRIQLSKNLTNHFWFIAKLQRNKRFKNSFITSFGLSTALVIGLSLRHQASYGGSSWLIFGAVLGCSLASEIRGLMRRYRLPEINVSNSLSKFIDTELISAMMFNFFVMLPIILLVQINSPNFDINLAIYSLILVVVSSVLGLLGGTLFVARDFEIGSQFMSAITAISSLLLLPKFIGFIDAEIIIQSMYWLAICMVCYVLILLIETVRRRNYGHI